MMNTDAIATKPDGYVTTTEFVRQSGYTLRALMNWIKLGKVNATFDTYANRWLIPTSELERVQAHGVADARRKTAKV